MLERWVIDPVAGTVATELLDDHAQEFPRADERVAGLQHRFGYSLGAALNDFGGQTDEHTTVLKHDVVAGTTEEHDLGAGRVGGEFVFVPADDTTSGEDEGWLMGYVYDRSTDTSDLVILDAHDFGADPVAVVEVAPPRARRLPRQLDPRRRPPRLILTSISRNLGRGRLPWRAERPQVGTRVDRAV